MEKEESFYFIIPNTEDYLRFLSPSDITGKDLEPQILNETIGLSPPLLFASINHFFFNFYFNTPSSNFYTPPPNPLLSLIPKTCRFRPLCRSLEKLCNNFSDKSSRMKINSQVSATQKKLVLLKLTVFALTYLNRKTPSKYLELFYDQSGCIRSPLESSVSSSSILGSMTSSRLGRCRFLLNHYNRLEATRVYKCSRDCDFIYFVVDCGLTEAESSCPYCHQKIGGLGSRPHRPDEQIILDPGRVEEHLGRSIRRYENTENTGFRVREFECVDYDSFYFMNELDFHLINLYLKCNLVSIIELRLYDSKMDFEMFCFDRDEFSQDMIYEIKRGMYKSYLHLSIYKHVVKCETLLRESGISEVWGFFCYFFVKVFEVFSSAQSRNNEEFKGLFSSFVSDTMNSWKGLEQRIEKSEVLSAEYLLIKKAAREVGK